jgi:SPP1 family predicted phage head-tail adaptor
MILNGKPINPGEMRTPITFESRTVSIETGGFQVPGWATIAEVWARWTNVHGSEVWAAASMQARQPATVLARYREDVDLTCAVSMGGNRYEILSIDDIQQRGEYMELKVQRMEAS